MGLLSNILNLGGLGESQDSTKQKTALQTQQRTKQQQAQVSAEEQKRTAETTTQQQETRTGEVSLLDPESEAALREVLLNLTGQFGAGGATALPPELVEAGSGLIDFSDFLRERAGGAEGVVAGQTEAIVSEARRLGENALEAQGTRLASAAGSNINSIVQAIQAQGRGDLESQLGALTADLAIRGRQLASEELTTAFGASAEGVRTGADVTLAGQQTGVGDIAQIANILRGATTKTAETGELAGATQQQEQVTALVEALQELLQETEATQAGTTTQKTKETPGLFDIIKFAAIG